MKVKRADSVDVIAEMKKAQGGLSLRKFADIVGCSAAYLSDIYNGRRDPGPRVLNHLGLRKIETISVQRHYERIA